MNMHGATRQHAWCKKKNNVQNLNYTLHKPGKQEHISPISLCERFFW